MPPKIGITVKDPSICLSLFDLRQASFEDIMKEHWHPSIRLSDIAEKTISFVEKNLIPVTEVPGKITKRIHRSVIGD
jgi:hypothetical protein